VGGSLATGMAAAAAGLVGAGGGGPAGAAEVPLDPRSLEHVRQGLLTMQSLVAGMEDPMRGRSSSSSSGSSSSSSRGVDGEGVRTRSSSAAAAGGGGGGRGRAAAAVVTTVMRAATVAAPAAGEGGAAAAGREGGSGGGGVGERVCWYPGQFVDVKGMYGNIKKLSLVCVFFQEISTCAFSPSSPPSTNPPNPLPSLPSLRHSPTMAGGTNPVRGPRSTYLPGDLPRVDLPVG